MLWNEGWRISQDEQIHEKGFSDLFNCPIRLVRIPFFPFEKGAYGTEWGRQRFVLRIKVQIGDEEHGNKLLAN